MRTYLLPIHIYIYTKLWGWKNNMYVGIYGYSQRRVVGEREQMKKKQGRERRGKKRKEKKLFFLSEDYFLRCFLLNIQRWIRILFSSIEIDCRSEREKKRRRSKKNQTRSARRQSHGLLVFSSSSSSSRVIRRKNSNRDDRSFDLFRSKSRIIQHGKKRKNSLYYCLTLFCCI